MNLKIFMFILVITHTVFCDYPWSPSVRVTNSQTNEPTIAVNYPYIYIAYNTYNGTGLTGVMFVRSVDGGINWLPKKKFDSTCCDPSLSVSENGKIHLSILGTHIQYYSSQDF